MADNLTVFFDLSGSAFVKAAQRMLMKLTPGVNFVNFLLAAFMHADPKFAKKTGNMSVFFVLLGSSCIKSDHRMLVKLTPD